jgi:hypothetical protein
MLCSCHQQLKVLSLAWRCRDFFCRFLSGCGLRGWHVGCGSVISSLGPKVACCSTLLFLLATWAFIVFISTGKLLCCHSLCLLCLMSYCKILYSGLKTVLIGKKDFKFKKFISPKVKSVVWVAFKHNLKPKGDSP